MAEQIIGMTALRRRLDAIGSPALAAGVMQRLAIATVAEAKRIVPRRTGNLGHSIQIRSMTPTMAVVVAGAAYAADVEFGTRPHEITPNARKALRFAASAGGARLTGSPRTGAAVVFARRVHHPGTRAQPFMLKGAEKAIETAGLVDKVIAAWNDAG